MGPRLVLVPGTFSDRRTWHRVVGALTPNFESLLVDPRGTGETPDPGTPFGPDELVDDVLAATDAAGFERAHLVGHSPGASVALAIDAHLEAVLAQDLWPVAGRIDAPLLAVAGAEDALTGPDQARAVAEPIPGVLLELIPACGHTPQVEQPAQLSRIRLSFLLKR